MYSCSQSNRNILPYFSKNVPLSLFMRIANCTNERLAMLNAHFPPTDCWEIMTVIGITFVMSMSYNLLSTITHYWSGEKTMGNKFIRQSMARNRFQMLFSKINCNLPTKLNHKWNFQIVAQSNAKFWQIF